MGLDLKNQRWAMLTNPYLDVVPPLSAVTEMELIEHSMLIDLVCDGRAFTSSQMQECRDRLRRFCWVQWLNRGRN